MRTRNGVGIALSLFGVGWMSDAAAGHPAHTLIGRCVTSAGDADHDGVADVLVGSHGDGHRPESDPLRAGALLCSGKDGSVLRILR